MHVISDMMHVILAVVRDRALVSLLVIYFLVNRQQRKKEKKQTSKPQDLVPKKDAKGGWGVGVYYADRRAAAVAVGLNSRGRVGEQAFCDFEG